MEILGSSIEYRKAELKKKYSMKIKHLEKERGEERKRRLGFEKYIKCKISIREDGEHETRGAKT